MLGEGGVKGFVGICLENVFQVSILILNYNIEFEMESSSTKMLQAEYCNNNPFFKFLSSLLPSSVLSLVCLRDCMMACQYLLYAGLCCTASSLHTEVQKRMDPS